MIFPETAVIFHVQGLCIITEYLFMQIVSGWHTLAISALVWEFTPSNSPSSPPLFFPLPSAEQQFLGCSYLKVLTHGQQTAVLWVMSESGQVTLREAETVDMQMGLAYHPSIGLSFLHFRSGQPSQAHRFILCWLPLHRHNIHTERVRRPFSRWIQIIFIHCAGPLHLNVEIPRMF